MKRRPLPRIDYYVYVFFNWETGQPVYVGKGRANRIRQHLNCAAVGQEGAFYDYLRKAKFCSKEVPFFKVREKLTNAEAFACERALMQAIGRKPHGLLFNKRQGGYRSEEVYTKIAASNRRRVVSEETRKKMSAVHKGKKLSEEHKKALSFKGYKQSDKARTLISQRHKGRVFSPEWRAKLSAAAKINYQKRLKSVEGKLLVNV